ncbi:nucleoside-diphosphate sugar epimerase/dehydratase [Candidatus Entotheonella palauensis]|uniref:Polysaccharide biosynthesis protein CapD-like domain-containing protein n=1 Tax=Candidatus Entotheonella gemina TaxID=1429439 RepID=W4M5B5_9BACT|nr:hypothetical protein [Candidatus Entotheonella palauensis]ETX05368.1 MAG: hypothetical protein ETSY2_23370 [Candidatus Entotheonella gemina]
MSRFFGRFQPVRMRMCFGVEFCLIAGAVFLAALIRFSTHGIMLSKGAPYLPHAGLTALVCQVCMYYADLYDFRVGLSDRQLYGKLIRALGAAAVVLTVLFYALPPLTIGRGIMLLSLPLAFALLVGWRLCYRHLQTMQQFRTKVLILGTGEEARKLAGELANSKPPGYEVKGFIGHEHEIGKRVL